jgi:Coenzyme PQQ synthesis protein D (PqqD)
MKQMLDLEAVYGPSDDIVAREIEGEVILVPLVSGMGDLEDELYTLNETGRAIWKKLDGAKPLSQVVSDLAAEYEADPGIVRRDVAGLIEELLKRKMVVRKA